MTEVYIVAVRTAGELDAEIKKKIKNSDVNVLIWHRFLIARFGGPYARRDPPKQTRRDECVFVFADDVRQRRKLIFRRKNVVDATDTNGRLMKYKFKRYIYIYIYIRTGIYRTFSSRYVCSWFRMPVYVVYVWRLGEVRRVLFPGKKFNNYLQFQFIFFLIR